MMMKAAFLRGASRPTIGSCSARQFSLLVPLQGKTTPPAEVSSTPITDRYFSELKA
jgi:hypothetical protein